jgi:hypothetical protein
MKSTILGFYNLKCNHAGTGLSLQQIVDLDDGKLAQVHGHMHWLFPLRKPSNSYGGPTLTDEEIKVFRTNKDLRIRYLQVLIRILHYLGFEMVKRDGVMRIDLSESFDTRRKVWLYENSLELHSITRMLQSLMLFGFSELANQFLEALTSMYEENKKLIGERNFRETWNPTAFGGGYVLTALP